MRKLLLGAALAWGLIAPIAAQQITNPAISGTNTLDTSIGGPGGQTQETTVAQLRNAQGVQLTALTGGSLTLSTNTASLITTAIVATAFTVTTPAVPFDGEIFELINGSGSANTATVTLTAATGQTVNAGAIATQAASSSAEWRYVLSTKTWYRVR